MKLKTLTTVLLALAACSKASTADTLPATANNSIPTLPLVATGITAKHISSARQAANHSSVPDYPSAHDLHEYHHSGPEADEGCKYHFSPDTLLTILFGAGGLIEPILIALFFHQVHNVVVQYVHELPQGEDDADSGRQPLQHGHLGGDFHGQNIPLQDTDLAAHLQRASAVYLHPTRPEMRLEVDEHPSAQSVSPPYSLTDVMVAVA